MTNKIALITGASSGIGKELAYLFAKDSYDLVLVARRQEVLEQLAKDLEHKFNIKTYICSLDLSQPNASDRLYEFTQSQDLTIHTLVNNAGFGQTEYFENTDIEYITSMIQLNITTLTRLTRLYLPGMLQHNSGAILNVGSIASFIPGPSMAVYFATKAYVRSFTESLSIELRNKNVAVTALCPGATETEFFKVAGELQGNPAVMGTMSADKVALAGYNALKRNQTIIVPGISNAISVQLMKRFPLWLQKIVVRLVLGTR